MTAGFSPMRSREHLSALHVPDCIGEIKPLFL